MTAPLHRRPDRPAPSGAEDQALVARVRSGDYAAFSVLFRAHYGPIFRFAERLTGSADVADDVVQDVFVAVWECRATWQVASTVAAYLHGAVRNRALQHIRRVATHSRLGHLVGPGASTSGAEELALAGEIYAAVARAIESLPKRCREVYMLRWYDHLTYAEIAHILGLSVKTVEMHVTDALRSLRSTLRHLR